MRRPVGHDAGDEAVPKREAVVDRWRMISAMTKADGLDKAGKLSTFNVRSETAAKSFTFGNAWWRTTGHRRSMGPLARCRWPIAA